MACVPSGSSIVVGITDGDLYCIDYESGKLYWSTLGHPQGLTSLSEIPGSRRFLTGGEDGVVKCWQVDSHLPLWSIDFESGWINCIECMPDGKLLVGTGNILATLNKEGKQENVHDFGRRIQHLHYSNSTEELVVVVHGSICYINPTDGVISHEFPLDGSALTTRLSPRGSHLALGLSDHSLRFIRLNDPSGNAGAMGPCRDRPVNFHWLNDASHLLLPDNGHLYIVTVNSIDYIIDVETPDPGHMESAIKTFPAALGSIVTSSLHPNLPLIAICSADGQVCISRVPEGNIVADFYLNEREIAKLLWRPSGDGLIYATEDGLVAMLELSGLEEAAFHG